MKIALIMEHGQAEKNERVFEILKEEAEKRGHTVDNYGADRTYSECAVLAAVLIASGAADYIMTGCDNGVGTMLAMNSMRNIRCGLTNDCVNAFAFTQINAGNCASFPFGKETGIAGELKLRYVIETLLTAEKGAGYPPEAAKNEAFNRGVLGHVKDVSQYEIKEVINRVGPDAVKRIFAEERVANLFAANCKQEEYKKIIH